MVYGRAMDFSRFKTSDWLMVGGGAAMLILGFALPWSSVSFGGSSTSGDGPFNYFLTGGIAWLLTVGVGVLAFLRVSGRLPEDKPWSLILLGMAGLATLLMLLRLVLGGRSEIGIDLDRGIGMYLAFVWAAIALAGAFLNFQSEGGDIKDLTDMDKLKSAFDDGKRGTTGTGGSDMPPPPPPPPPPSS